MDKQNTKNEVTAKKVLWISLVVDIIDVLSGIVVTIISGSVVMLSQVLEGIADLACSGLLVFGLKRSKKKADRNHPFGYGKELYFWTLISARSRKPRTAPQCLHRCSHNSGSSVPL